MFLNITAMLAASLFPKGKIGFGQLTCFKQLLPKILQIDTSFLRNLSILPNWRSHLGGIRVGRDTQTHRRGEGARECNNRDCRHPKIEVVQMTAQSVTENNLVLRQEVLGSRRLSNYFWAVASSMGGLGFLLAGLSSYFHINLLLVSDTSQISFMPQGIALTFYGIAGTLVGLYLWLTIIWDVGSGYNEFNKTTGQATIFRAGFPGKNRQLKFTCDLDEIQSVRAEIREGLSPQRKLYLRVKQRREIPLTRVGQPLALSELENKGAELARFLSIPLEGL